MKNLENTTDTEITKEEGGTGGKSGKILILITAISIVVAGYFAYQYYILRGQDPTAAANAAAKAEVANLVKQVGKIIDLPAEEPTVATVVDAAALKSQAFFAKAQKGDKVLIYPNAKKAYLYSPTLNKIIEVGPVSFAPGSTTTSQPAPEETPGTNG